MECSTPALPVHHQLPEFSQTHVHWVPDTLLSTMQTPRQARDGCERSGLTDPAGHGQTLNAPRTCPRTDHRGSHEDSMRLTKQESQHALRRQQGDIRNQHDKTRQHEQRKWNTILKTNGSRKKSQEKSENTIRRMEMETLQPTQQSRAAGNPEPQTPVLKEEPQVNSLTLQLKKLNNNRLNPESAERER